MSVQPRETKIFAALLIAMTAGIIILKTLGNTTPSAGAFSLSDYYLLNPVEKVVFTQLVKPAGNWSQIEIYCADTKTNINNSLRSLSEASNREDINCHFIVCDGITGLNGQILPTLKWQQQQPVTSENFRSEGKKTIRIWVITGHQTSTPTDFQRKRTQSLTDELARKFDINLQHLKYPDDWE